MNRVALLDWDGTLRPGIMLLDWAAFLADTGAIGREALAELDAMALRYREGKTPYEDFVTSVLDGFAAALRGTEARSVERAATAFAESDAAHLFPLTRPLLAILQRLSIEPVLISGSPVEPLAAHAKALGIRGIVATRLEVVNGRFSGVVLENAARTPVKQAAALSFKPRGIAFAAGDRPVDAMMVELAAVGAYVGPAGATPPPNFPAGAVVLHPESTAEQIEEALRVLEG